MTEILRLTFNDGYTMPQFGFGIWQVPEDIAAEAVEGALRLGYPLIDGAYLYLNEAGLGEGLRASGVPYDVRKAAPYMTYGEYDFEVPVGTTGDCFDRFIMRFAELKQSARIIDQALEMMDDDGPINVVDPRIILPPKEEVYSTIEGTIQHFKIVMEGLKIPAGEVYSYTEGGNGELGFYIVSDGSGTPYRVRIRPPCFYITGGLERIVTGQMVADVVPCFGSLNMIGGECDR